MTGIAMAFILNVLLIRGKVTQEIVDIIIIGGGPVRLFTAFTQAYVSVCKSMKLCPIGGRQGSLS